MHQYTVRYTTTDGQPARKTIEAWTSMSAIEKLCDFLHKKEDRILRPGLYGPNGEEILPEGEIWF